MSNAREMCASMGMRIGPQAEAAVFSVAQYEMGAFTDIYSGGFRSIILAAAEKQRLNEPLSIAEAALLAEVSAFTAYLYALRYIDDLNAEVPDGRTINFAPTLYRILNFYRTVEFLNLAGVLRDNVFESNKLFLGAGAVIADVYPFTHRFEVVDVARVIDNLPGSVKGVEIIDFYDYLEGVGAVRLTRPAARIIAVDNDEWLLQAGLRWAETMGITVEGHLENARQFVHNSMKVLKKSDIGLIVIARLDPLMVGGDPEMKAEHQRKAIALGQKLTQIARRARLPDSGGLQSQGQILMTVGLGCQPRGSGEDYRDWSTYIYRQRSLRALKSGTNLFGTQFHIEMAGLPFFQDWLSPEISDLEVCVANAGRRSLT